MSVHGMSQSLNKSSLHGTQDIYRFSLERSAATGCRNQMKLYNTLTRQKEEFIPLQEGKVSMYVCGPTVYNYIHIGNARPMIVFDTVRRYMEYKGYEVNYVSNFTDVDDKIIKKSIEEGIPAEEVAKRYIAECKKDMADMNVRPATTHPLATEEIQGMLDMISTLIEKGYAYAAADGTVYYRTRKFKDYGKLSHKNIDDLQAGHRDIKVTGELKEDPLDFVLWKPKKDGEPYWDSPWCKGRPGWHIECSVMSKKYLGDEIDIHAGGEDLIFPHHENEIAQSEAANGKQFAKYWLHNAFLNIDNKKMSKSLGNFFTVREIGEKYDLQVLRFFMLSAHYRSPLNFSADLMEAAKNGLERIVTAAENLRHLSANTSGEMTDEEKALFEQAGQYVEKFEAAMDDDFNTADGISAIFEYVKFCNTNASGENSKAYIDALYERLAKLCDVMGILIEKEEEHLDDEIEALIAKRQEARAAKDFAKADEIRDQLLAMGIILKDTREGVTWKRA
jgi:cysteinyl-tRNA synthetase